MIVIRGVEEARVREEIKSIKTARQIIMIATARTKQKLQQIREAREKQANRDSILIPIMELGRKTSLQQRFPSRIPRGLRSSTRLKILASPKIMLLASPTKLELLASPTMIKLLASPTMKPSAS